MAEKTFITRVQQKIDTEANWDRATFTSKKGEIYFYDKDSEHDYLRMKVGNNIYTVKDLDFIEDAPITNEEIDAICDTAIYTTDEVVL